MPISELTDQERDLLGTIALELRQSQQKQDDLYARRLVLWRELIDRGVSKGSIARASDVTHAAINFQLEKAKAGA